MGAICFCIKMITWIASYPKSGNTWVRMLLSSILTGNDYDDSIDANLAVTGSDTSKELYQTLGIPLGSDSVKDRHGRLNSLYRANNKNKYILKTHSANLGQNTEVPLIPYDITERAVIVVRNPLDTICSVMNHFGLNEEQAGALLTSPKSNLKESARQFSSLISSWDIFYDSWLDQSRPFPILVIRYEDLHTDTVGCCERLCEFLCVEAYKKNISNAVKANNFHLVKRSETNFGFKEQSEHSSSFFNKGEVGQFRGFLSDDLIDEVVQKLGKSMKKLGYDFNLDDRSFKLRNIQKSILPPV